MPPQGHYNYKGLGFQLQPKLQVLDLIRLSSKTSCSKDVCATLSNETCPKPHNLSPETQSPALESESRNPRGRSGPWTLPHTSDKFPGAGPMFWSWGPGLWFKGERGGFQN